MPRRNPKRQQKPLDTKQLEKELVKKVQTKPEHHWQQPQTKYMIFNRKEVQERINHLEKRISEELRESHYHLELARHYLVKVQELQAEKETLQNLLDGTSIPQDWRT